MNAYYQYLNDLVNENKRVYREWPGLKWLNAYEAEYFQQKRDTLLAPFKEESLFKGTKPFYREISTGCKLCGRGKWSCLFITGKCNANCFYCPTPQLHDEEPTSQGLTFSSPEAYAEYINYFGFKGASFSGGEPLLFHGRVLAYLQALRKHCSPDLYIWMYTNGIMGTEEIFDQLAEAGLDEVRFDIGATGYDLAGIAKASGRIPHITVEIPAVPEEQERLKQLLPELIDLGVTRLNLHQMRLTPHNVTRLSTHDYTYIPAERPFVMESEFAALEIMNYAKAHQLKIGINYCAFHFKFRFQKAGYRSQLAGKLAPRNAVITEKGFLRTLDEGKVSYKGFMLADAGQLNGNAESLNLQYKQYDMATATAFSTQSEVPELQNHNCTGNCTIPEQEPMFSIWRHETIESDLRDY